MKESGLRGGIDLLRGSGTIARSGLYQHPQLVGDFHVHWKGKRLKDLREQGITRSDC